MNEKKRYKIRECTKITYLSIEIFKAMDKGGAVYIFKCYYQDVYGFMSNFMEKVEGEDFMDVLQSVCAGYDIPYDIINELRFVDSTKQYGNSRTIL